jgi:hypothetical protein
LLDSRVEMSRIRRKEYGGIRAIALNVTIETELTRQQHRQQKS